MKRWDMCNGNVEWVNPITLRNIDLVLDALEKSELKYLTISQISKLSGVNRVQVKEVIRLLAYRIDPFVKVVAGNFINRCVHNVHLIKKS